MGVPAAREKQGIIGGGDEFIEVEPSREKLFMSFGRLGLCPVEIQSYLWRYWIYDTGLVERSQMVQEIALTQPAWRSGTHRGVPGEELRHQADGRNRMRFRREFPDESIPIRKRNVQSGIATDKASA